MQLLIARGCSVNQLDSAGHSPLHSAALLGHTAAVRLLLQHRAVTSSRTTSGQTPLHVAADSNRIGEVPNGTGVGTKAEGSVGTARTGAEGWVGTAKTGAEGNRTVIGSHLVPSLGMILRRRR